jgi:GxxExxY protein
LLHIGVCIELDMNGSAANFAKKVCDICFDILVRCGPFMKETIYQDLLIHELNKLGIKTTRELVFNYRFVDSEGKPVTICNNQFLRTDIEIPEYECILEMKCTTTATKDEQLWQLRNYLENREDRSWGILINFINKFGARTSPKVQCDLLCKTDEYYETKNANGGISGIRKYHTLSVESVSYPTKDEIITGGDIE